MDRFQAEESAAARHVRVVPRLRNTTKRSPFVLYLGPSSAQQLDWY